MEGSYDNIVSYRPIGTSHQGPIDYMENRSLRSTTMATPSGRPSTITPAQTPQSPHIITSDEDSIFSQTPLPPYKYISYLPQPSTKVPPTEPINVTLQENFIEPLSVRSLNLVHKDAANIPPIPPSLMPAPCTNQTQFEYLNIHCIFCCRKFFNQKYLTSVTNASIVKSVLLPSAIRYFATINNPTKGKTIKN